MHEKILDEPDFSNFNSAKQARLDLRRLRIRRYLVAFWTIFIGCFSFAIALAYTTNMREAAQMFGLANTDDMGNIFVAILVAAIVGYIGGTINWFRYELLPYTLAWPLSTCRDALYKRASRYGITAAAFIVIPLFLYLNFSLPQFGNIIGVPPARQSGGTSEVVLGACMLTGFIAFIICIMHNYRAPKYKHPED